MNNKFLVGLVVLLVGVGAGWYFLQGGKTAPEIKQDAEFTETTPAAEPTVTLGYEGSATGATGAAMEKGGVPPQVDKGMERTTVMYGDSGFLPKEITVKVGTNVSFLNQSSRGMWVASAMHPTHQLLPGFDQLKSVGTGGTYEYTFVKVGTWKYHNHVQAADIGTVVVTE